MCSKCFLSQKECKCSDNVSYFDVDDSIFDIIKVLNLKGYTTTYCCGGHVNVDQLVDKFPPNLYIKFTRDAFDSLTNIPDFLEKERSTCIIRYYVNINNHIIWKPNIPKRNQNVEELITSDVIESCEKDLKQKRSIIALWVNELPYRKVGV